jgi:type IV secretory pathway VirB10-like protein
VKGDHKLEVTVNGQDFSKMVTVAKKPAAAAPVGGDMTLLIAVVIIVIVALAAGAVVWAGGKKKAAAPPTNDQRVAESREAPIEYRPIPTARATPHAPPPGPPPVPPAAAAHAAAARAPAAPPVSPSAPAVAREADAREAVDNLERIIQDAEAAGLDVAKARQTLKIARSFIDMEKYEKAMSYCKTAEDQVG